VKLRTEAESTVPPGPEAEAVCARFGAPEGGVLGAPALECLLEAALAAWPGGRVALPPSLLPAWGARVPQAAVEPFGPGDQVWLDLGGPEPASEAAVDALLARAGEDGPLAILLRDDDPRRARTQRLAVDRPGRVLLLREAAGCAYALGSPQLLRALEAAWAGPRAAAPRPGLPGGGGALVVLDVDGVLIDPGRAFMDAVAGALEQLAPGLAWRDEDYLELKRAGGFNNDFRLAAAALARAERGGLPAEGWPGLDAAIRRWEPACRTAVRGHYAHTRRLARPLVTREQLDAVPGALAICTGRPPDELETAFALLGFTLPAVSDRAPHLRKPRPEGLVQLADAFRAERVTFVGDGRDDAAALRGARALRPELDWRFAAVGADRGLIASGRDLRAATLTELLESGELA